MIRSAAVVVAALSASGVTMAVAPLVAHAATVDCATLATQLVVAADGASFTLSDNHLCTETFTIKTGSHVSITGADANQGFNGQNSHYILNGVDIGATVIQNLIFQGGKSPKGAAISFTGDSTPQLLNLRFYGNNATGDGGAVFVTSTATSGGPILVSGSVFGSPSDASKANNAGAFGGGLDISSKVSVTLSNNTFGNNTALADGGGADITISSAGAAASLTMTGNQFVANTAAGNGGGAAVRTRDPVQSVLSNNVFRQNRLTFANDGFGHLGGGLFFGYPLIAIMVVPAAVTQSQNVFDSNVIEAVAVGLDPLSARPRIILASDYGGGGEWVTDIQVTSTRDQFTNNTVMPSDAATMATPCWGRAGESEASPVT